MAIGPGSAVNISHHAFDDTVPAYLAGIDPSSYDNVLLLRSERLRKSTESDSRTILAYLLLREVTAHTAGPNVLMELTDADNSRLFENRLENEHTEIVVTSRIVSHMLARVALRRELRCVFDELQKAVDARDNIAIGIRRQRCRRDKHGGVLINPGRDQTLELGAEDELILLFKPD
ncbi:hypothetical protein [Halochromatium roseum]|uniref:hypothetical protein n=1 Tax=Halochromatium roseum TaxID=391920 RepID=UPI001913BD86|nr:hypothetical protein [Halochromatium roseum]MBK5940533.1 hypothetical protein [Halochromatium roseum]